MKKIHNKQMKNDKNMKKVDLCVQNAKRPPSKTEAFLLFLVLLLFLPEQFFGDRPLCP